MRHATHHLPPLFPCSDAGAGFSGTDHVFYLTAKKTGSCGDNTIAYTIICHMEAFTFRPNVAAINLCPRFWTLGEPLGSKQVSALVHEMIHGLVSLFGGRACKRMLSPLITVLGSFGGLC
jgi:hypothetical protein